MYKKIIFLLVMCITISSNAPVFAQWITVTTKTDGTILAFDEATIKRYNEDNVGRVTEGLFSINAWASQGWEWQNYVKIKHSNLNYVILESCMYKNNGQTNCNKPEFSVSRAEPKSPLEYLLYQMTIYN